MAKTVDNEEVLFYYNMALAVLDPQKSISLFETQMSDDYWRTIWAIVAYCNNGVLDKASNQLMEFNPTIYGKPEDDQIILEAYCNYMSGNIAEAIGFLDELMGGQSELLTPFYKSLEKALLTCGAPETAGDFYSDGFFTSQIKALNKEKLVNIIKYAMEKHGNECDLNFIDTSGITDMKRLFAAHDEESNVDGYGFDLFNGDISKWDVSNVQNMCMMFYGSQFNGDISRWNVGKVTEMGWMFAKSQFDDDISEWDVSKVDDMSCMFYGSQFNGKISKWDVSNVQNMSCMFHSSKFNGNISKWDISNVTENSDMIFSCAKIPNYFMPNKDRIGICRPTTKDGLVALIKEEIEENGNTCDLNFIDTGAITDMSYLFSAKCEGYDLYEFNGDISKWDVGNVKDMSAMFMGSSFNGDISKWDVRNVKKMGAMFESSEFNGDISKWDVSGAKNMNGMFFESNFKGNISMWDINNDSDLYAGYDIEEEENDDDAFNDDTYEEHRGNGRKRALRISKNVCRPTSKKELISLIKAEIKKNGNKCDLNFIDTSEITDMSYLFGTGEFLDKTCTRFNGNISEWDVSNVTNMEGMFYESEFDGDISDWDVSNVENMKCLFYESAFNGNISAWDVSNVTDMSSMFEDSVFNGDISEWDVSNVTNMDGMFDGCDIPEEYKPGQNENEIEESDNDARDNGNNHTPGNRDSIRCRPTTTSELKSLIKNEIKQNGSKCDLNFIDTSAITDMSYLFAKSDFDGDISQWDVSCVTDMSSMFSGSIFTGDISSWDVSMVTRMYSMFGDSVFNGDISKWDVSNVTDMSSMFSGSKFTGDISKWNVSNVENMRNMFNGSKFTGDISKWNVSNVTDMSRMFYSSRFTGDISKWNVRNVEDNDDMFSNSKYTGEMPKWKRSKLKGKYFVSELFILGLRVVMTS